MNFEAYFSMLQNAAQQVDHENRANKRPVKRVINYLDLTPDEFEELSSPPSVAELSISKAQAKPPPGRVKMYKIQTLFMCHTSCSSSCLHGLKP